MKAILILHREEVLQDGRFVMSLKVYEVEKGKKFPDGIKAKYLLQDVANGVARLLVDNHQPYGFHMHTKLPADHAHRETLTVKNCQEALNFFLEEVGRILKNEET